MPKRLAIAALTVAFLAAGAFSVTQADDAGPAAATAHTTVIAKNSQRPLAGSFTAAPCIQSTCWDI